MSRLIRNIPLLLQLLFWYNAVLKALPEIARQLSIFGGGFISTTAACIMPQADRTAGLRLRSRSSSSSVSSRRSRFIVLGAPAADATGQQAPVLLGDARRSSSACRFVVLLIGRLAAPFRVSRRPAASTFAGGIEVVPEFAALLFGLSIYTAAFIAEVVRAGILAVSQGQTEAAYSLGLRPGPTLRLIVVPQAMRVIIPPLTSQYLNLTKNSSLAVAIGYPDLVQVFTGTVLNQTGQAIEVVAITMAGLSRHQPRHLAADEHLQPPHGAGGTVRAPP